MVVLQEGEDRQDIVSRLCDRQVLGGFRHARILFHFVFDRRWFAGTGSMVIDSACVRDGENQCANTVLSTAYTVYSGKYCKENILGNRFGIVDPVSPKVSEDRGRQLAVDALE